MAPPNFFPISFENQTKPIFFLSINNTQFQYWTNGTKSLFIFSFFCLFVCSHRQIGEKFWKIGKIGARIIFYYHLLIILILRYGKQMIIFSIKKQFINNIMKQFLVYIPHTNTQQIHTYIQYSMPLLRVKNVSTEQIKQRNIHRNSTTTKYMENLWIQFRNNKMD